MPDKFKSGDVPEQIVFAGVTETVGVGFTVIVTCSALPGHPLAIGVMVYTTVPAVLPVAVNISSMIFPVPEDAPLTPFCAAVQVKTVPLTLLVRPIAGASPEQIVLLVWDGLNSGVGFTVIVKLLTGPAHPFAKGLTLMVAVTGVVPVLTAVKAGMLPVPAAARPIDGWSFSHANVVPVTLALNTCPPKVLLLQILWLATAASTVVGLTVIVKDLLAPAHEFAQGVTVIVAVSGVLPVLVLAKAGIFPVPLAASPIDGLLLTQLKLVPATAPLNVILLDVSLLQST